MFNKLFNYLTSGTPTNRAGYTFSTDGRCGPNAGNTACSGKACCSLAGWCGGSTGGNDDWCDKYKGFDGRYNAERPSASGTHRTHHK
jgi:hypothetical protein